MRATVTKSKWWWGWAPEKVERWLEEQELQGYNVVGVGRMGVRFSFIKGSPRQVRYCVDYQTDVAADYRSLYEDDGWELVHESMGWYIWRKPYSGERPEIYTDVDSLVARNNRLITLVGLLALAQVPSISVNWQRIAGQVKGPLIVLQIVVVALLLYAAAQLWAGNRRLKARRG